MIYGDFLFFNDDYGGKIYCLWCFMVIFLMVIIVGKLYSIF